MMSEGHGASQNGGGLCDGWDGEFVCGRGEGWVEEEESVRVRGSSPASRIRTFLRDAFRVLEDELPEDWPVVSVQTYARLRRRLRESIERLYEHAEHVEGLDRRMKVGLRLLGESALHLMRLGWEGPTGRDEVSYETLKLLSGRPCPKLDYDQLYCTPDSTQRRVERILQHVGGEDGRVLFLGDDDLGSLLLAREFSGEIHVVELDQRLLGYIRELAPEVKILQTDLVLGGIPQALYQSFDVVVLDPPWDMYGAWCFLYKALYCLKDNRQARILMSFCPLHLEYMQPKLDRFERRLAGFGLTYDNMSPAFNLYDLHATEFSALLQECVPLLESPLLEVLRGVPFGFSHLYEIRRLPYSRVSRLRRWFFKWWHSA